jgi:hypothetical protein
MEYIGGDSDVDICERQRLPKWHVYGLDVSAFTSCMKHALIFVSKPVCIKRLVEVVEWIAAVFAQLIGGNRALRTPTIECTGYQSLLWVIANEDGKNGMAEAPDSIATCHHNAGFSVGCSRG